MVRRALVNVVKPVLLTVAVINLYLIGKVSFSLSGDAIVGLHSGIEGNLTELKRDRDEQNLRNDSTWVLSKRDEGGQTQAHVDSKHTSDIWDTEEAQGNSEHLANTLLPDPDKFQVTGTRRSEKGFLTIGIPSVKRPKDVSYLSGTLDSLIQTTTQADKEVVVVLVFLCDNDADFNAKMDADLRAQYSEYISSGFLQLLRVDKIFYPPLQGLKQNFNDSSKRVSWRAKQVVDFSFMFLYARNISEYYMQIEDDVKCARNFVSTIRNYIRGTSADRKTRYWAMLEFSELGFIGKLVRSSDLVKFAQFLRIFYEEQPVDWLMWYFRMSMGQRTGILRKPTLFQHKGLKSSLPSKTDNKLRDKFFQDDKHEDHKPPAKVFSTMLHFKNYLPQLAYSGVKDSDFFWARFPQAGDTVVVGFDTPLVLNSVLVETGKDGKIKDILQNGTLEVGYAFQKQNKTSATCSNLTLIANFTDGTATSGNLEVALNNTLTACLRIVVNHAQMNWIVFHRIVVQVQDKPVGSNKSTTQV